MKALTLAVLVACATSFGAIAQTSTTSPMPAPKEVDKNAPLPGANSFTESQAKGRLEENGYSNVGKLTKDDNGVWKGPATHAGSQVTVSVDYRGNITRN